MSPHLIRRCGYWGDGTDRRAVLLGTGALVLGGCTSTASGGASSPVVTSTGSAANASRPYQLGGGKYFSDQTHHDHVHAGFSA